ncbi:hypothetical protein CGCSCA5_v009233 [Colletotrichum siamense]|uniref:Uncharacterized protein n=1 Tax=Colletotrichum chrysophilum TaxID=1836956 RepID=A0AAD9AJ59_9PEZI|nr:uncharacterized protein CGCS363_v005538 [Colletotrichum siamense]KAI8151862.1 hypothetical protein KHU50_011920 [Colletotrichum sp. SAR 10_65]KAI8165580.1 hypothetical protein K4K50_010253 [Colletotrichum sp. SAR 10_71]KAI8172033.1 hypothetical protein K4K51_011589 [Colletotrichum sp. SAR 10_75]KAI8192771.1 hypothetical protein K4K49_011329 [Colletotrichum sp. SAR 10_70]KAI8231102.1 hypothetical protein K4K54_000226 [Colletotrichum sp. SAR 10_86]KAI8244777.1 hypothetical protein K4K53_0030
MVSFTQLLTFLAASVAVASPVSFSDNGEGIIEIRAGDDVYVCKAGSSNSGALYGEIKLADAMRDVAAAKTTKGSSGYPKPFGNLGNVMNFASGCSSDVWELPVLPGGKAYNYNAKKGGNSPGPIRVFYNKNLQFCGIGAKEKADGSGNPHNCALKPKAEDKGKGKGKDKGKGKGKASA